MASASFQNTESNEGTRNHKDFNLRTINLLSAGMGGTIDLKPNKNKYHCFEKNILNYLL